MSEYLGSKDLWLYFIKSNNHNVHIKFGDNVKGKVIPVQAVEALRVARG
jgi:hypothetical protein